MNRFLRLPLAILGLGLSLPALADTYNVDPAHSQVAFEVSHMMISTVRGEFSEFEGTLETDAAGKLKGLQGKVSVVSVDTREAKRDGHLKSPDFFDVEKYATMSFQSTKVKLDAKGGGTLTGDLTIRGVTKPVSFQVEPVKGPITDPWGNIRVGTVARATIDRQDFGLSWNNTLDGGGVVVGDEVDIVLELEAARPK